MRVVAYDPYVTSARAQQLGVQLVSLDELVEQSDFITIHMPKTPETTGMIGAEQLTRMKPTAYRRERGARRAHRRGRALQRADRRRDRGCGTGCVHLRAPRRPEAARPAERRRHPAPRREHRRGAGEGRRVGRELGAPRARRRPRSRRCQCRRWSDRPVRPPRHPARREARPGLRGPFALTAHEPRRRGARRAAGLRRQRAQARGTQGPVHEHRERVGLLRQRAAARRAARGGRATASSTM